MKNTFDIPNWFDNLIDASHISNDFQEKRTRLFLKCFPPIGNKKYLAFSSPFSDRIEYYLTRKKLKKYSLDMIDEYGDKSIAETIPKFILPHNSNQLFELEKNFYYITVSENTPEGSHRSELVIFVDDENNAWTKRKVISAIKKVSKKLYKFENKKRLENMKSDAFDKIFLEGDKLEDIKMEVDNFLSSQKLYSQELKLPWKRGLLFVGPPGNGKTSLLRAICDYFGLTYKDIKQSIQRNGDVDVAESSKGIDKLLYPSSNNVTVWIMEDIDKLVDFNGDKESLSSSVSLHDVLKGLDGINQVEGALILATTNYGDVLTESLANRPGRFDRIIEINVPKFSEILKMLNYHHIEIENGNIEDVAQELEGFSMAFVEEYVKSIKMIYKRNKVTNEESNVVLNRILKHNKDFENKFQEKGGLGFGK